MAYGTLYLIPCPISDETAPWEVLPASNREVMVALDYFIVENTRSARRFLSRAGIARPIDTLEFRELNEHTTAGRAVEELDKAALLNAYAGKALSDAELEACGLRIAQAERFYVEPKTEEGGGGPPPPPVKFKWLFEKVTRAGARPVCPRTP